MLLRNQQDTTDINFIPAKMYGGSYQSGFVQNLKGISDEEIDNQENINKQNEWRFAVYSLVVSLSVIATKIFYANRNVLYSLLFEDKLLSYVAAEENGRVMYRYVHSTVLRSSSLLFPLLCGLAMTAFTWLMIYFDSSVPGIQPPSPLSPSKYKVQSGHSFHLGYMIAIINGLIVFSLLFFNGIDTINL